MGRKISSSTGLGPRFGSIVRKKHAKVKSVHYLLCFKHMQALSTT